ncbi:MAG: T9SS type A sorting domain-containing protein, partial [Bacteroidales bacterium]|nr:T9SS type A sorting domain-containing protein [Bacteroidales bacterium]
NPATDALHLNIDENATLSITDIQGRRLLEKNVSKGDNEIDISELSSGMYIYQVSGDNSENKIGKFIKK